MGYDLTIRGCTSVQVIAAGAFPVDDLGTDFSLRVATTPRRHAPRRGRPGGMGGVRFSSDVMSCTS